MTESSTKIKSKNNKYKILFWLLLILTGMMSLVWRIDHDLKNRITIPPYNFSDYGFGIVSAEGSWLSDTELAFPISTTVIDCWENEKVCHIANSYISDGEYLALFIDTVDVQYWNDDFIETMPSDPGAGCVEEFYRLDRRSQTVTHTRRTIDNKSDFCKGIQDDPIISKLGDGFERLRQ